MNGVEVRSSRNKGNSDVCVCVYWQRLGQPCGSVTPGRLCWELKQIERCGILALGSVHSLLVHSPLSAISAAGLAFTPLSPALFHTLFLSLTVTQNLDTSTIAEKEKPDMTAGHTDFKTPEGCFCKGTIPPKVLSALTPMLFQPLITFFPP